MSELDRREEWMGLGIVLTELRMKTWVENRSDSKLGMRVQKRVGWRSLFKSGTEGAEEMRGDIPTPLRHGTQGELL